MIKNATTYPDIIVQNLPGLQLVLELPIIIGKTKTGHIIQMCRRLENDAGPDWDKQRWRYYIGFPRSLIDGIPDLKRLAQTTPYWGIAQNRFQGDTMEGIGTSHYYYVQPVVSRPDERIPWKSLRYRARFFFGQWCMALAFLLKGEGENA